MRKTHAALTIAGLSVMLAVAGCSSSASSPTSSSPSPTVSGTSSVLPPIPITKSENITAKVGDYLNVTTPNVTRVSTNNAKVLGPGKATLSVYGGITNLEMYSVTVTATN